MKLTSSLFQFIGCILFFALLSSCTDSAGSKSNYLFKFNENPGAAAKINGIEISISDLESKNRFEFYSLKKREHELRMQQLDKLVTDKILGAEAASLNISIEEFIFRRITKGDIRVTDSEIKDFAKEKKIPDSELTTHLKDRIKMYFQAQKREKLIHDYIAKVTKKNPVEVYLEEPTMSVDMGKDSPVLGKNDADHSIVVFTDFQCPYCATATEVLKSVQRKYSSDLKVVYRQYPLAFHADAKPAGIASYCLKEQKEDFYWKFSDYAYKNQQKLDRASLEVAAKRLGANVDSFKTCMDSGKYAAYLEEEIQYAKSIGLNSTPVMFVDGVMITGAPNKEALVSEVEKAIERKKRLGKKG